MPENKSLRDQVIDLLIYAPIGALVSASEDLSGLVEKGRNKLEGEVSLARLVGNFAVNQGHTRAARLVEDLVGHMEDLLRPSTGSGGGEGPGSSHDDSGDDEFWAGRSDGPAGEISSDGPDKLRPSRARSTGRARGVRTGSVDPRRPARTVPGRPVGAQARRADPSGLAIPGYDSLSASQVVQRLAGLTTSELEAVRSYEDHTRGRKTIVNRSTQLLADQGS
ncbi:MAG: hypothetical protein ACRD0I_00060 [Acidimicrobiales bacterium]